MQKPFICKFIKKLSGLYLQKIKGYCEKAPRKNSGEFRCKLKISLNYLDNLLKLVKKFPNK